MQALFFLRVLPDSTLEQQHRDCERFCAHANLDHAGTFRESAGGEGESFQTLLREAFSEHGVRPVLVVACWSVLGDGARAQARRYLQLASLQLDLRLADGRDPDAELVRAWRERGPEERRAERSREAMRARALRGEALGRPPYGYRVEARRLTPEAREAAVVREMFRACIEDRAGIRRIAQQLNAAGQRTRRGRPWATASVREILRNPVYTGTYRRMGVVVPGAHPALIPRGEFARAQRLIDRRRTGPARQRQHSYLLSGLATCGYCGNRLIGMRRRRRTDAGDGAGEYVYYQCESRTNQGRCDYHTRRADELERAVGEAVASLPLAAQPAAFVGDAVDAPSPVKRRRSRERALEQMLERRASGQWTARQLLRAAAPLVLAELDDERLAAERAAVAPPTAEQARAALAGRWHDLSFDQRRSLLRRAVAAVVVTDDRVELRLTG